MRFRSSTNAAHIDLHGIREELRFFIEHYRQGHRETTDLVSSESLKTREHISLTAERTRKAVALVDRKVDGLVALGGAQMDSIVRERFLQSLKYPEFNWRRNQVGDAHGETLDWVFVGDSSDDSDKGHTSLEMESSSDSYWRKDSDVDAIHSKEDEYGDQEILSEMKWDSFSNWLRSTDPFYWISGKPGSGKTTLVKYILAHERTKKYLNIWSPGCKIASHFFWRPGSQMQKNIQGLLCSLLYQLLGSSGTALNAVMSSVPDTKESYQDWPIAQLRSALRKTLGSYENGVCMFLDGLDEIDPEDATKDGIPELLDFIVELSQRSSTKFCLASRPDPRILETRLSKYPRLRLQDLNHKDLMVYAKNHIKFPNTKLELSGAYRDDPIRFLVDKAEGVFLWLILATKSINEGIEYDDSAAILMERVNRLPKGLEALYQNMWERASVDSPSQYRKTAALYFKLLLASGKTGSPPGAFNIFSLMLATTPTADRVMDALDGTSNLVCPDTMLDECRQVQRMLKISCFGLVEVAPENAIEKGDADNMSWYRGTYDSILPLETSAGLRFLHRTANDFLCDTESGAEILASDKSSDFTIGCQLMKAWLARLALFADRSSVGQWSHYLEKFRKALGGTNDWVMKDWHRLILRCEKLANSGRLFTGDDSSLEATPCVGPSFLRALVDGNCDDEFVIERLKNENLSPKDKSNVLLGLSDSRAVSTLDMAEGQSRLRTFCEVLSAGADPNWQVWETETQYFRPFAYLRTPWRQFLYNFTWYLFAQPTISQFSTIALPRLAVTAEIICVFLANGAKLDDMIDMVMIWNQELQQWNLGELCEIADPKPRVLASIPACDIVGIIIDILRHSSRSYVSLEGGCASLERARMESRSSKDFCAVVKVKGKTQKAVLWKTTDEMQIQLGIRLVQSLRKQLNLTTPDCEGDDQCQATRSKMPHSILDDAHWTMHVHGKSAIFKWLEHLKLVKPIDQSPTLSQWVTIRQKGMKSQSSGVLI